MSEQSDCKEDEKDPVGTAQVSSAHELSFDETALHILGLDAIDSAGNPIPTQRLARLGSSGLFLDTAGLPKRATTGAWLVQLPDSTTGHSVLERFVLDDGPSIDVFLQNRSLQLRQNNIDTVTRLIRHDLSNRLNSIKVNAELVRLLAEHNSLPKLTAAALRILNDCADGAEFTRSRLPQLLAAVPASYLLRDSLEEMVLCVGYPENDDLGAVQIQVTAPAQARASEAWITHMGGFLQRMVRTLRETPAVDYEEIQEAPGVEIVATSGSGSATEGFVSRVTQEWRRGRNHPGSLAALSPAAGPFSLTARPDWIRLRSLPAANDI